MSDPTDSPPPTVACAMCFATGHTVPGIPCIACDGTGSVPVARTGGHSVELHEEGVQAVCSCGARSPVTSWDDAYDWQQAHERDPEAAPGYRRQVVTWDASPPSPDAVVLPMPPSGVSVEGVVVLEPGDSLVVRLAAGDMLADGFGEFVAGIAAAVNHPVVVVTGDAGSSLGRLPVSRDELIELVDGALALRDATSVDVAEAVLVFLASRGLA